MARPATTALVAVRGEVLAAPPTAAAIEAAAAPSAAGRILLAAGAVAALILLAALASRPGAEITGSAEAALRLRPSGERVAPAALRKPE